MKALNTYIGYDMPDGWVVIYECQFGNWYKLAKGELMQIEEDKAKHLISNVFFGA